MKNNLKPILLSLFLLTSLFSLCQPEDRMKNREFKSLQRLYSMPWYKRLKENRDIIEGDPKTKKGAIYSYLEHVKQHPECVNPEQFAKSKLRYEKIVSDYNNVIDLMIKDVTNIVDMPIKDVKIDIKTYKTQYDALEREIPQFVNDLELELVNAQGDCHRAASVIPVEEIVDYIIIPLIDFFKRRKLEQFKLIVIRELEKLKLDPATTWDEIEVVLKNPQIQVKKSIEETYHLSELDYCRLLHLPMKSCYERDLVEKQYELQTSDIKATLSGLTAEEMSDSNYFNELLQAYTEARDALLSKCQKSDGPSEESLKERIKALIIISDGCVPIDQLEKVLNK